MTMQRTPLLLWRLMGRGPRLAPEEEIVTLTSRGKHRQSYRETRARAAQLAHALRERGIRVGDRVASLMWNGSRHLEVYYAVPSMGAVLHTLNLRLGPKDLEYIINHAEDRVIVVDADLLPLLEPLAGRIPSVALFVVCGEPGASPGRWESSLPEVVDYEEFIGDQPTRYDWPEIDENAPLGLCYTSGTTGNPKGVMYTHRSTYLHTITAALPDLLGLSAADSVFTIVPMFHAMGWGVPFAATMLGAKQVYAHRFMDAESLLDLMDAEEATISNGVPTIWQGVRAALEAEPDRWDLSKLERLTCGGSAPPLSLIRWYWDHHRVEMLQGWGMTETNPLCTLSRKVGKRKQRSWSEDRQFENVGKAGLLAPGLEIEIVDDDDRPLPHDGESFGEVVVRGPWICSEYYRDAQPDKFLDGWLRTGDVAKIDPEEYLIITDRAKDLIKSGGEWISSVDVENHICALEGVAQAAVVAQPHPKWDERPVAIVVRREGSTVSARDVLAHCADAFAKWQLPDDVLFEEEIPLTATGKIDKKRIRSALQDRGYALPDLRG